MQFLVSSLSRVHISDSQRGDIPLRLRSGQKRLSFGVVAVLSSLSLQELDELVEDRGNGGAQEGTDPVDPVRRAKVEGDQVRSESPSRVQGATSVVDSGQPVTSKSAWTFITVRGCCEMHLLSHEEGESNDEGSQRVGLVLLDSHEVDCKHQLHGEEGLNE